ncbi:membrane bound O-acyltransferase, MBOAT protein (macronuclear) [Tetrahymena thermophila SB210]|uniref:O-acyltransferase n=1 Tax=Tetrahymena thermophila (strain SB210) TaxID=312017 RepID=Q23DR5_TETTS|nr:membrane bound O-acyltransferase, MBOAT protein [Tetrahymena thermophila SB210]EAR94647.2 membrane bound O-acyltransferase, MBOAT protein [Tetrahymena thermophila SB210]|eukprot:XP_001014621.2 membrane bound O-acyltransferase, MBOAT protein [Tetrahymena thermophila SB210]
MSEVKIKFYQTDHILFLEKTKAEQVVKDDVQSYQIKTDPHHIDILENKNQILCTFLCDITDFQYDESSKVLKIFYKEKKDSEPVLMLEMTSNSRESIREVMENINERKVFVKYKGPLSYNPAKMNRTSLLSTESPEQNYRGFLNAAGLALLANNIRSIVDNAKMYGIQLHHIYAQPFNYMQTEAVILAFILFFSIMAAFIIQKLNFSDKLSPQATLVANAINIMFVLIVPVLFKQFFDLHFLPSIVLIMISCVIWLKLISYAHVLRNVYFLIMRIRKFETDENKKKKALNEVITESEASSDNLEMLKKHVKNPEALLKLKDLFYFLAAPTLCFQLVYPRTQRIRKVWLAKRFVELIFTFLFQTVLWVQYVSPLLEESYELSKLPENKSIFFLLERMLKLSIPNLYFWVSGFFGLFQVFLNITAELLRYGDRQFYLDWWNCRDLEQYWRMWNLPVHNWCVRHFYNPMLKRGFNKVVSNLLVFTLSAFLHEWIVSGALNVVTYHSFLAMWLQAPIIIIQRRLNKMLKLENSQLGNVAFWISFCFIGQPAALFLYYEIYRNKFG